MNRSRLRLALLLAAACPPFPALAQDAANAPIVVTGRGLADTPATIAYDIQTLPRDRLLAAPSGRIEDALADVAGFQQFRRSDSRSANPSAQGVTLRALGGNATSRTAVLLDAVPQADPFFGYVPLSALVPERLASARITRGGGSGAFAGGAVAGTIDLTSAGAGETGLLDARALVNQRGESEVSASIAPQLGQGFVVASARWDRGQGFFTTPASQRAPATVRARFDSLNGSLRAVAPLAPGVELQARFAAFDDGRTLRFAGANSASSGQDASLRIVARGRWQVDALAYVQARGFRNATISANTFRQTVDAFRTPSTGAGGKLELRPPVGGGHVLRLGTDVRLGRGDTSETTFNAFTGAVTGRRRAGGRNGQFGLYAEDDWRIGALTLTGGARADRWTITRGFFRLASPTGAITTDAAFPHRKGWEGTFRGGAALAAAPRLTLRAAGYTGFRLPTLNELYRPFTVPPVTTTANAALVNERLAGVEAGADFAPAPGTRLSVTVFSDRVAHAIANVTTGANLRQRQNVDAIRARGVELDGSARLGALRLSGSLALTDAEVRGSGAAAALNGKRPAQTPKLSASATLGWAPARDTELALTLRHTGAQFEDDLETDRLPPATTLGLYAQVPLAGPFRLILRGENLLDEAVVTRNQAGSIDLGTPRTLWAGVRVQL